MRGEEDELLGGRMVGGGGVEKLLIFLPGVSAMYQTTYNRHETMFLMRGYQIAKGLKHHKIKDK
jgi:hypothetical protein